MKKSFTLQLILAFIIMFSLKNQLQGQEPDIINHPLSQDVLLNEQVQFKVQATGANPLTYQWYKSDVTQFLHKAVRDNRKAFVEALIEAGAKLNAPDEDDATPLHHAAHKGYTAIVRVLIEAGA